MRLVIMRFAADMRGNFAIVSALLMIPLAIAVGLAVDITSMNRTKAALQRAMDSASLAIAREGEAISDDAAKAIAREFVVSNFGSAPTTINVVRDDSAVTVRASTDFKLSFAGLLGYTDTSISAASTAQLASLSYEVGLVLDTAGSMASKMQAMKGAVLGLIDALSLKKSANDEVKLALVPFSTFVNVGPQFAPSFDSKGKLLKNTGAKWLDKEGKSSIPQLELKKGVSRFEAFNNLKQHWAGCVETRKTGKKAAYDVLDLPPDPKKPDSLFVPAFGMDEPDSGGYSNSYIVSDVDPLDKSPKGKKKKMAKYGAVPLLEDVLGTVLDLLWTPVPTEITSAKGPNASCTSQPVAPLTDDFPALEAKVQALKAGGATNITEGVMWGWRVLSPGEPFTEGKSQADDPTLHKIMIVVSGGSNDLGVNGTELGSAYSSEGYLVDGRLGMTSGSEADATDAMNAKTLAACTNAKAAGIEIYTIRLEEPDVKTGALLKDCASDASHFFDAPSRSDLDAIFKTIKTRITNVRLAS
jgi:Flp pilus assembly protein TadG